MTLKMGAGRTFETSVTSCQTTQRYDQGFKQIFIIVTMKTTDLDIIDLLINILLDISTEAYVI